MYFILPPIVFFGIFTVNVPPIFKREIWVNFILFVCLFVVFIHIFKIFFVCKIFYKMFCKIQLTSIKHSVFIVEQGRVRASVMFLLVWLGRILPCQNVKENICNANTDKNRCVVAWAWVISFTVWPSCPSDACSAASPTQRHYRDLM